MNGEEIELDGERGNRPICNLLFVCENFHCLNAFCVAIGLYVLEW